MNARFARVAGILLFLAPMVAESRTIQFAGRTWVVRSGMGDPGPNAWSDSGESVWVDNQGWLHLKIRRVEGRWNCSEVTLQEPVGYGDYNFQLASNVEKYDPNVVVGLFPYKDLQHEIDIEFSRWRRPQDPAGQYVLQPSSRPGNMKRFGLNLQGDYSTHRISWREGLVYFQSWHGHHEGKAPVDQRIQEWTSTSPDVPQPSGMRLHLNFWLVGGLPPADGKDVEVIIASIKITPTH